MGQGQSGKFQTFTGYSNFKASLNHALCVTCCCQLSYHERMAKVSSPLSVMNVAEEPESEGNEGDDKEEDQYQPQPELD